MLLANIMARPDTPKMPLATTLSLIWASSSNFPAQFFSAVRTPAGSAGTAAHDRPGAARRIASIA
jgi:hypothetical protein